tara:strand:+ start:274 stop:492 length:219 start_codon:yes stop_codon:yes gene_type:complete
MKAKLIAYLLPLLLNKVLDSLPADTLERFADNALDFIEDAVADSENKIDDAVVLPLCEVIRDAFHIEDNDND